MPKMLQGSCKKWKAVEYKSVGERKSQKFGKTSKRLNVPGLITMTGFDGRPIDFVGSF